MVVEKKEKLTIKKPVVKKATAKTTAEVKTIAKKTTPKKVEKDIEIKEISSNQVKMIKKTKPAKSKTDSLDRT